MSPTQVILSTLATPSVRCSHPELLQMLNSDSPLSGYKLLSSLTLIPSNILVFQPHHDPHSWSLLFFLCPHAEFFSVNVSLPVRLGVQPWSVISVCFLPFLWQSCSLPFGCPWLAQNHSTHHLCALHRLLSTAMRVQHWQVESTIDPWLSASTGPSQSCYVGSAYTHHKDSAFPFRRLYKETFNCRPNILEILKIKVSLVPPQQLISPRASWRTGSHCIEGPRRPPSKPACLISCPSEEMSTCLPCQKPCSIHPHPTSASVSPAVVWDPLHQIAWDAGYMQLLKSSLLCYLWMGHGDSICILTRTQVFLAAGKFEDHDRHCFPPSPPPSAPYQISSILKSPHPNKKETSLFNNKFLFALSFSSPSQKSENCHLYLLPFSFFPVTTHSGLTTLFSVTFCYCSGHSWDII